MRRNTLTTPLTAAALLLLVGCSGSKDEGAGGQLGVGDTAELADDGGTGEEMVDVRYWRLDGTVVVTDGVADAAVSEFELTLISADRQELCSAVVGVSEAVSGAAMPDPTIYSWWELTTETAEANTCGELVIESVNGGPLSVEVPWTDPLSGSSMLLGVGAMHPEIEAVLGSLDGLGDGAESTLNGAYASFDGGEELLVFGVAGSLAAYQGEGIAALDAPLPDGTWIVRGLYAFSL